MKLFKLTFFVATIFFNAKLCNAQTLHLLQPRESFNTEILNNETEKYNPRHRDIMLVRIEYTKYYVNQDSNVYYAIIFKLNINDFKLFSPPGDKYFGYFVYSGHLVLVYGDQRVGHFFTQTEIKKTFALVSLKEKPNPNRPPVSFEPAYITYIYKHEKFIKAY